MFSRLSSILKPTVINGNVYLINNTANVNLLCRRKMGSKVGSHILPPEPPRTSFGIMKIFLVVVPGLLIGAAISKSIANFLEENDLFVPSDDDDDDD